MTASIRTQVPRLTERRSAPDRRLQLVDERYRQFAANIFATANGPERVTEVEVQSFAPDGNDMAVVSLNLSINASSDSWTGAADVMMSPAEARLIAQTLIVAAFEAEGITQRLRWPDPVVAADEVHQSGCIDSHPLTVPCGPAVRVAYEGSRRERAAALLTTTDIDGILANDPVSA